MRRFFIPLLLVAAIAACATPGKDTAIGAGGGAVVGAGVGALAGGWEGAAIGALVGGVAGGAIGNYFDKQEQELKQVADARRTEDGILVDLRSSLLFTSQSAVIRPAAADEVARLGDVLAKYPKDRIRIVGYADSSEGTPAYEEQLSLRRAEAVRAVLESRGVSRQQMLVEGGGASNPIADNSTPEGRAQNRRVELRIDAPQA